MNSHINITLILGEVRKDLRLPKHIEVSRLIRELDTIFKWSRPRRKYQIRVLNKGLLLDEGKYLSDWPVETGDILEVMEV